MSLPVNNITQQFADVYFPKKALLFYHHAIEKEKVYIEMFDCSKNGQLSNAHPLSEKEIGQLAKLFHQRKHKDQFLECEGVLSPNILHLNMRDKCVIWYTPVQQRDIYFTSGLQLPNGKLSIPALIWKATATELSIFATKELQRPSLSTPLYHAPFYNVYDNGNICMGTVRVDMRRSIDIIDFMNRWERYFFNSKFSHFIGQKKQTKTEITTLYRRLLNTSISFPEKELIPIKKTLQQILP